MRKEVLMDTIATDHRQFISDGRNLVPAEVARVARSPIDTASGTPAVKAGMSPGAEEAVQRARAVVEGIAARGEVVYGITTGFGAFKDKVIPPEDLAQLQVNLILSQCVGVGT